MRLTKLQHLEKENSNLKNKLSQIKVVVKEMGQIEQTGAFRETIMNMFNLYTKLKEIVQ